MRFYADENFPMPVIIHLCAIGHDVLTTLESAKAGQAIPDEDVLVFSSENQRILLTFNRKDFIRLHQQNPNHGGIVVCTVDANFEQLARRINEALTGIADMRGFLVRINRPQNIE